MQSKYIGDKRKKIRVNFTTEIIVQTRDEKFKVSGSSKNLSVSGMFVKTDRPIPTLTECLVEVVLTGMSDPLTLMIEGRVVRSNSKGVAISFHSMDLDSYAHLKNIVRYNVENPDDVY